MATVEDGGDGAGQSLNIDLTAYPNLSLMMQASDLESLVSYMGVEGSSLTDESEDVA